jgi:DNA polymerase III alpha subunit (gram-positive type)
MSGPRYAELQVTSHFSFLRGASSCDELFAAAAVLGIGALAVVDRNSLAGVVRAHEAAKVTGVHLVVGCRLDLRDGESVLVYPTDWSIRLTEGLTRDCVGCCRSARREPARRSAISPGLIWSPMAKA